MTNDPRSATLRARAFGPRALTLAPAPDTAVPVGDLLAGCTYDPATGAVRLPLSAGGYALVDADIALQVARYRWHWRADSYPYRKVGRDGRQWLHHVVCPCAPGGMVDHINGDRRDARRANLRPADDASNQWNRQTVAGGVPFKGVCVHRDTGRFQAQVRWHGRTYFLGLYADPTYAAVAYWLGALALFGEYAWTNLPEAARQVPAGSDGALILRRVARAVAKALRDEAARRRATRDDTHVEPIERRAA